MSDAASERTVMRIRYGFRMTSPPPQKNQYSIDARPIGTESVPSTADRTRSPTVSKRLIEAGSPASPAVVIAPASRACPGTSGIRVRPASDEGMEPVLLWICAILVRAGFAVCAPPHRIGGTPVAKYLPQNPKAHSIMPSRVRTSTYKGATVVIRWQELKRADPPGSLFIAGYALTSGDGRETEWRQFDSPTFHTHDAAVPYALAEAHRAVDAQQMPLNGTPKAATGSTVH
jgi:hypothetical protein